MSFNPRLKDFTKEYKDLTLIGLLWSCYWRFVVAIWAIIIGLSILLSIPTAISSLF